MSANRAATALRGRSEECRTLDGLLDQVRTGRSSTLVIRGICGVGKSALLDYVAGRASGCRVLRAHGVESERGFAYAGLLQLCGGQPLERADRLPAPQRAALMAAFGLAEGPAPEAFLVGLAALSLLSDVAEERPLVCLADDFQWLDRESVSALSFVARRLEAESIVMLLAVREPFEEQEIDGLPALALEGLGPADANALLDATVPGGLDAEVRERIVVETRGNPLALLEVPRGLTPAELAGGFGLPDARGESRMELFFIERVHELPAETQVALLVAAADGVGDGAVIAQACAQLGIGADAIVPAEDAGLVELGPPVRFRHPTVRAGSYRAATPHARRQAHAALATATDPARDPDRRAWHLAHAAAGPDENVAAELERSAARAQARGGVTAAAAFFERAAELTPDPSRRASRALAAAQLKLDAGALDTAEHMLAVASSAPLGELDEARVQRMRACITFARSSGGDAPALLSAAAKRMEPLDPELARETHLEALWATVRSARFGRADGVVEAAAAAAAPAGPEGATATDLLLEGVVARLTQGYEPALPTVARALGAFRAEGFSREHIFWCWLACQLAMDLWEDDTCEEIASGLVRVARERGGLNVLPFALNYSAAHQLFLGELRVAEQLVEEARGIVAATRIAPRAGFAVLLAAWRGERERTEALRAAMIEAGTTRSEGFAVEIAEWAAAVLHNGLGEYAEAQAAAERAYEPDGLGFGVWVLPELIEAAVRSGDRPAAELAFERLTARSRSSATAWARGVEAAARAMLTDAEEPHLEAVDQLGRSRVRVLHARAQLTYGEWLRREGRRVDAREQLKAALGAFERMGAEAFAERTRRELLATGETVRKRSDDTRGDLTPQEAQIARLASDRLTNPEIGAQLYLSPRTVEYHLRKVFQKLGISSRRELAEALHGARSQLIPA
jgi:DNA-binding CsgD family transcriptional regulator